MGPTELLKCCLDDPGDRGLLGVLGDALEEQGDPRAALVRMTEELRRPVQWPAQRRGVPGFLPSPPWEARHPADGSYRRAGAAGRALGCYLVRVLWPLFESRKANAWQGATCPPVTKAWLDGLLLRWQLYGARLLGRRGRDGQLPPDMPPCMLWPPDRDGYQLPRPAHWPTPSWRLGAALHCCHSGTVLSYKLAAGHLIVLCGAPDYVWSLMWQECERFWALVPWQALRDSCGLAPLLP